MSGDVTLTADISFIGKSTQEHRQGSADGSAELDEDSPYADVTLHGNGMTALQTVTKRARLRTKCSGHLVAQTSADCKARPYSRCGSRMKMAFFGWPRSARLEMKEPFYLGIGLCSHDKDVVEKAVFTNVD